MVLRFRSAARSHAGNVRELNEDAFCEHVEQGVWCVADGMGGHEAGEVAAQLVVEMIGQAVQGITAQADVKPAALKDKVSCVRSAIHDANTRLTQEHTLVAGSAMMGCTVLALITGDQECACVWAGDSRLYLLREHGLYQLSKDHSVVQELLDKGLIGQEETLSHPQRHVITRAVGANPRLELDYLALDLVPNDVLLLCSDGLYSEIGPDQILSILTAADDCDTGASRLLEAVLSGPAKDNVTVNVIAVEQG
ncbi:MAG: protein phosphatase [Pseudomonadales bacterium]|jgi:serine/threonine protein phosphatase Stp1|uniref:PP2C family protein-serine/threonine phosphatase n=1 Tax=unclassified Ketobacter TaxID=2639109 RepID=UPI000C4A6E30|nr:MULTISPECIES: protein phosphatase 2C domain-containing protein [unclassified Ketobacter]MAA59220.1 protein phosphatase [Pseudomonadales bacterium]MEC8810299.1 protein phosphatase 2C domain-containing protein [Pseudomonadota bacterium]HAG95852.1 protein phosphatase [Gammaproteobacteria bacterium]MAQ23779.1 protein phosphatase [Pseudomonadales bacterium]MBI26236.1 protein phosphatase [Pseudomonadales bacterium]|tara:strand:- start:31344 stop:32099 length:756 start_codon:yes stop_codon:yes gene_type:complete